MLGIGGILAEAVADVAFRLAPLDRVDAEDLVDDLRMQALLGPFRGEPAVDRDVLITTLLGLSALATNEEEVVSVDVNPLIVVDGRPVAVDALVEVV
jgi:acetyl-CoA synthetase (ADP-forming)